MPRRPELHYPVALEGELHAKDDKAAKKMRRCIMDVLRSLLTNVLCWANSKVKAASAPGRLPKTWRLRPPYAPRCQLGAGILQRGFGH
jgi:hypothetical protein